jgi:hypothetical protein
MNTFLGLLAWVGSEGAASGAMPSGTRLSVLSIELPRAITPALAGLTVGAFVGVVGFIAVLLLVGRGSRRGTARRVAMRADQVVFIPPYGTLQRDTPLPPAAFQIPPASGSFPAAQPYAYAQPQPQPYPLAPAPQQFYAPPAQPHYTQPNHGHGPALPFRPSTDLSARAFAKMGYDVAVQDDRSSPHPEPEPLVDYAISEGRHDDAPPKTYAPPTAPPVSVSAIVVVEESGGFRSAEKSAPHPLGVIPTGSSVMRAAPASAAPASAPASVPRPPLPAQASPRAVSFADEPPQPRRRSEPPKIRAVAPAAPRFPVSGHHLPHPTPPPTRAVPSARG